jgi:hypothetical protein
MDIGLPGKCIPDTWIPRKEKTGACGKRREQPNKIIPQEILVPCGMTY